jgi:hypothetical protein
MVFDHTSFDDGRGRYPDRIAAAAPRGFRDQVKRAAQAERITMGEFVRRAICERISTIAGLPDDDGPSDFPPAAGQRIAA